MEQCDRHIRYEYDVERTRTINNYHFYKDLEEMFANSRNSNQLKHAWTEWRKISGEKYRKQYLDFIALNNKGAKSLGYIIYTSTLNKVYISKKIIRA